MFSPPFHRLVSLRPKKSASRGQRKSHPFGKPSGCCVPPPARASALAPPGCAPAWRPGRGSEQVLFLFSISPISKCSGSKPATKRGTLNKCHQISPCMVFKLVGQISGPVSFFCIGGHVCPLLSGWSRLQLQQGPNVVRMSLLPTTFMPVL